MNIPIAIAKGEFEELHVQFISVLRGKTPANGRRVVVRAVEGETPFYFDAKISKVVKGDKPLIYICVYEPNVKDSQGDSITAEKLQKAAHDYLKNGLVTMIDENHNFIPGAGTLVESFILNSTDDDHYPGILKGAWCGVIEPSNELLPYLDEITGVSLAGTGIYKEGTVEGDLKASANAVKSEQRLARKSGFPLARQIN